MQLKIFTHLTKSHKLGLRQSRKSLVSHDHVCWLLRCAFMCLCSYCKHLSVFLVSLRKHCIEVRREREKIRQIVGWTAGRSGQESCVGQCVLTWGTMWMSVVYSVEPFKWMFYRFSKGQSFALWRQAIWTKHLKLQQGESSADNRLIR